VAASSEAASEEHIIEHQLSVRHQSMISQEASSGESMILNITFGMIFLQQEGQCNIFESWCTAGATGRAPTIAMEQAGNDLSFRKILSFQNLELQYPPGLGANSRVCSKF
jgi:hypothetical protein